MEGIICIEVLKCYRLFSGIFRNSLPSKTLQGNCFLKEWPNSGHKVTRNCFYHLVQAWGKKTPLIFIIAEGHVGVMLYPEKSGHCPQVPSQKWDMQGQRPYSNSKDSHPSGPSKSCTAEIILFRDKVRSLLSDRAEEGKLTHLPEALQTLEPPASFSIVLHHLPQKNKTKKPLTHLSDTQQHKWTWN